jgi:hypothetical protein
MCSKFAQQSNMQTQCIAAVQPWLAVLLRVLVAVITRCPLVIALGQACYVL